MIKNSKKLYPYWIKNVFFLSQDRAIVRASLVNIGAIDFEISGEEVKISHSIIQREEVVGLSHWRCYDLNANCFLNMLENDERYYSTIRIDTLKFIL